MYIPEHFAIANEDEIYGFVAANAFGQLISRVEGRLFSSHLPFLLSEDRRTILGHVARQNPQHADLEGQEVLITLQGAHGYISPGWYADPGVPTWNYQAVHIYGHGRVFHDKGKLRSLVESLTKIFEQTGVEPWQPRFPPAMLQAIVGIEVAITQVQCKYKLSQNRPARDRSLVIQQLRSRGDDELAEAMERNG